MYRTILPTVLGETFVSSTAWGIALKPLKNPGTISIIVVRPAASVKRGCALELSPIAIPDPQKNSAAKVRTATAAVCTQPDNFTPR